MTKCAGRKQAAKRKILLAALLIICVAVLLDIPASANLSRSDGPAFCIRTAAQHAQPGSTVQVQLSVSPGRISAGAFRILLQYDEQSLEYCKTETAPQLSGADIFVRQDNPLVTVYTCDVHQGSAALLSGDILTYDFRVKQDAPAGEYRFCAYADQVCSFDGSPLPDSVTTQAAIQVQDVSSDSSMKQSGQSSYSSLPLPTLTALEPDDASLELTPAFQPDITAYQMTVPPECGEVWFRTAQPEGTAVKVSRHTLLQNGQNTVITVTAVSSDGRRRRQYTVTVCHEASSVAGVPQATGMVVAFPQGTALQPAFSPSIHNYEITVPAACSQVYLKVDIVKPTKVSVSRCTLQPAGRDTAIIARLTTDSGESSQYQVIVHRLSEPKGMTPKPVPHQTRKVGSTQKSSAGRRFTTFAGRNSTAKRKAASRAGERTRTSRLTVEQQDYTPSAAIHTGAANGKALNVVGTEGFSGFQTGVLVVCLTAVAAVLGVLGTRAWCRKHQNPPTKSNKQ